MSAQTATERGGRKHPAPLPDVLVPLRSGEWELGVLPRSGGAIAFGRVLIDGTWHDLLRPTRVASYGDWGKTASYPLVPWSNRVRDGVLRYDGRAWQLGRNAEDGTAIHGAGLVHPWQIVERTDSSVTLELDTADLVGVNFPWTFRSRVRYSLEGAQLRVTTELTNTDSESFPAGFGHHPYFLRRPTPVTGEAPAVVGPVDALLHVPSRKGYVLDHCLATGAAGTAPARVDYSTERPIGTAFVDDIVTDLEPGTPITITYPDAGITATIDMDEIFSHVVVFVPRGRRFFAVEPVTNVNDGAALFEAGVPGTGIFVLAPGETRSGTFTITVDHHKA